MSIVIAESGRLRVQTDWNDPKEGGIYHLDLGELLRLKLCPAFVADSAIQAAETLLANLRPAPPKYVRDFKLERPLPDRLSEGTNGFFEWRTDTIHIVDREAKSDLMLGAVLLHELIHATGISSRCARYNESLPPPEPSAQNDIEELAEEVRANMAGFIVANRVGIWPFHCLKPQHWLQQMSRLPVERLPQVIDQAQRAADFLLPSTKI